MTTTRPSARPSSSPGRSAATNRTRANRAGSIPALTQSASAVRAAAASAADVTGDAAAPVGAAEEAVSADVLVMVTVAEGVATAAFTELDSCTVNDLVTVPVVRPRIGTLTVIDVTPGAKETVVETAV